MPRRKDGRWVAALTYWEGGRRVRRAFYFHSQDEARKRLTRAQKAHDDGLPLPLEQLTVKAFLAQWLEAKQPSLRPESFRRYREMCELHLMREMGRKPLSKLTPADVQAAYAHCRAKGLSGTSLQLMHGVLHKALDDAARWNLAVRNVADLIDVPRRRAHRRCGR